MRPKESKESWLHKRKLWGVVKQELKELGEKFGEPPPDADCFLGEETLDFDAEAYIVRENTNVVLTRDGWIKRVGRLAAVESTRVREGDDGHRRGARQYARSRHLLRGRRRRLHDADQRSAGIFGLWRADGKILPAGRPGPDRQCRDDR